MALDTDKIDDAVLALLFLTRHDQWRAWKGFDWEALNRLHRKGMIADPVNKAKSVVFSRVHRGGVETLGGALPGHVHQAGLNPLSQPAALKDRETAPVCRGAEMLFWPMP